MITTDVDLVDDKGFSFYDMLNAVKYHTVHVTHNDLDGVGCIVANRMISDVNDVADYVVCDSKNYENVLFALGASTYARNIRRLYITDLPLKEQCIRALKFSSLPSGSIYIYDHHETKHETRADLIKLTGGHGPTIKSELLGKATCATELFYYANLSPSRGASDATREFVTAVTLHDTFRWKTEPGLLSDLAYKLNLGFIGLNDTKRFVDLVVGALCDNINKFELPDELIGMASREDANIKRFTLSDDMLYRHNFDGYKCILIDMGKYARLGSYIASDVLEANPDVDFVLYTQGENVQFRGHGKIDLGEYIRRFNGGGHFNAAGCSIEGFKDYIARKTA
ncbi:oligoribonuclease NrnB/cAMP/cGMP phosphodiesterase (DHH superfamily) [Methanococcus maripaludis]|uniref:Oligoribonuclease NrnB/cAMP/cGMP phosphodiesterase (DHH superfamily) n=1 Tax=Methanococcus maripaludis TaxID=39152 RepID=A0A7J9NVF2_METMI|nr:hypothetical protein [Methanococcus maripaludis]MBA2851650.1 oligoribonuclease NrnB/cAMP/cGMP phosphodiesterase (DHH superfamily) [Methanococcus maripaludis]